MNIKERLLNAPAVPLGIDGFEGAFLKPMLAADYMVLAEKAGAEESILMVELSLVDETGKRIFADGEANQLPASLFTRVLNRVLEVNSLDPGEAAKN